MAEWFSHQRSWEAKPAASRESLTTGERSEIGELVEAIKSLVVAVSSSNTELAHLSKSIAAGLAERSAEVPAVAPDLPRASVNWVIGPKDNIAWAYGNNANRLSGWLEDFDHTVAGTAKADIALYFDAIVANRFPAKADKSVLRIGGPRPLDRLYGADSEALRAGLESFDAIIALNTELYLRAVDVHPNVHLIPNGLDLGKWNRVAPRVGGGFRAGFAASLKSSAEAETKGYAIAVAAAARADVELVLASKGSGQIPHDKMREEFYSKIDVLIHPVGPGREGSSNVIMEALASGVPVITTVHSGFHGEYLVDGHDALVRERGEAEFAEAILELRRDPKLKARVSERGRLFAQCHHDLKKIAESYDQVFRSLLRPKAKQTSSRLKVAFLPFWEPVSDFGSSRLRAQYPANLLSNSDRIEATLGYAADADVVVVIQMCSDQMMAKLQDNRSQFVIYDVCDKYYENPRLFKHLDPPVDSLQRYKELIERADLVVVPSREMKVEIASRIEGKAVKYLPEPIDYGAHRMSLRPYEDKVVLWFGNPGRGNFESARWMISHLRDKYQHRVVIVSQKSFFKRYPEFYPCVTEWSVENMKQAFASASICVLGYSSREQAKSANRFIAATMHGIPTLVSGSPACREILEATGHHFAVLSSERELDKAVSKLRRTEFRNLYVTRVQRHLEAVHGESSIMQAYQEIFEKHTYLKAGFEPKPPRVLFVSHNLALGEGAPYSLLEMAKGLRGKGIVPVLFSACSGPLHEMYREAKIPVEIFDMRAKHVVKVLSRNFQELRRGFLKVIRKHEIDAVICNTVKSAAFAEFAHSEGIPCAIIVRESYTAEERFSYLGGESRLAAIRGLTQAEQIVFVANTSRDIWLDQPFSGEIRTIPNGISRDRFDRDINADKLAVRAALGLPEEAVICLCVGTINARKGQRELLLAYSELPTHIRKRSHIVYLGAVDNKHLQEFRRTLSGLSESVQRHTHIIEARPEVGDYYRAADLFLMNSSSEAYPRSIVEALYFGLPVLSTAVFGVQEQIDEGKSGYLYDQGDMGTWQEKFSMLVLDERMREEMARQAKRSYWKLTSYDEMLLAYKCMLGQMLSKNSG